MIDTVALREKVLDLAIRGKLVPQDPNDEPASVLLERIREQKQQMVKVGKLKAKDIKDDSVIFVGDDNLHYEKFADGTVNCIENEMPFELPNGWEWVNLGTVCDVFGRIGFRGYTKGDFVSKGEGAISLSPSNIVNNSMNYDNCSYITWQKYEESPEIMIYNGDILLVKTGSSYGKSTIVQNLPEKATINPQFVVLKNSRIITSYLCYFLQSPYCISMYEKFVGGTAIPTFSQANLKAMYVAVPPIQEQSRIVSAIRTAEEQIILIGDNNNELQTDINLLKSKILDLAIRGKLVPQNPEDEPASVLLERTRAEKEELIKQGKIKRDKKESIIFKGEDNSYYEKFADNSIKCIDDEIPFKLPISWEWCKIGDIFMHNTGKALNSSETNGTPMTYITTSNLYWDSFILDSLKKMNFLDNEIEKCTVRKGDLLVCEGGDIGRAAIWQKDEEIRIQNHIHKLRPLIELSNRFYYYVFFLWKQTDRIGGRGIGLQGFSSKALHNLVVPLPPIREQIDIVTQVDSIFEILDSIEKSLD